ncbi:MAG: chemotaxis response regulator protein-glutamate methylesterase [Alphaproteobacteria bacterium]|nr:chemotaxis response regulator protein-glutamate methylesterase [Alphaproteobacteria bacterium]
MVVDDSVVVRSMLTRILESDPEIKVVASFVNGQQAVDNVGRLKPDVVVLDIEMPVMDGLTALPKLIEAVPGLKVVMASTLTRRNAEISLQALDRGAADYVAKPEARADISGGDFKQELLRKVKVLAAVGRTRSKAPGPVSTGIKDDAKPSSTVVPQPDAPISLQKPSTIQPQILAIGSSTGGPKALTEMLATLDPAFNLPIVIAQHMPETFTTMLAEHIGRVSDRPSKEGEHGEVLKPGHIYVAPGDYHMTLARQDGEIVIQLDQGPRENFCRPAVDRLFVSVAELYGGKTLAVVLTGMGSDGLKSSEKIIAAKGTVVTQDAETSVVWGMPGVVATAGFSCANLPLLEIGPYVSKMAAGGGQ